ncbi:MAG TPA: hypothetical protein VMU24_12845 [Candidatus Acidoferrales bacterium]|nr:hypothetical protein [Candidatus Acidoferrales bacterium]
MRIRLLTLAPLIFALIATAFTQTTEKPIAPAREPHLAALEWMTHGTWHAEFTTPDGKPFIIDNEIRWAETGTSIVFTTRFNGHVNYHGIYVWDPQKQKLRFFYTSANGEFTEGETVASPEGLVQNFTISSAKGVEKLHSTVKRKGDDQYDFAVFQDGSTKPEIALTYTRR